MFAFSLKLFDALLHTFNYVKKKLKKELAQTQRSGIVDEFMR